ncbi:MAG: DapH/DapD/GlmU-related protein [Methylococcaceae bacterium]|jgi:serine acetyltransferase
MSLVSKYILMAHRRRWPDRSITFASCLWLLACTPGLRLLVIHAMARWLHLKRIADGRTWYWRITYSPLVLLLKVAERHTNKTDIQKDCEIEGYICLSDQGHIILGAKKIGSGSVIGARVTIGRSHVNGGRPIIGRNVWIGSDCVIYGAISIGDGATLLPGTVISKNIPANIVMQGNPARLVLQNFDNAELRDLQDLDAIEYIKTKWDA